MKKQNDPRKTEMIKNIFNFDDELETPKPKKKIIVKYNETVYFKDPIQEESKGKKSNAELKSKERFFNQIINDVTTTREPQSGTIRQSPLVKNILKDQRYSNNDLSKTYNFSKDKLQQASHSSPMMINHFNRQANKRSENNFSKSQIMPNFQREKEVPVILSILCMNCGNSIPVDDIEEHSKVCTKVSEEVLKNENNKYEVYHVNYKLKKLGEHVNSLTKEDSKLPKSLEHEVKCISTLLSQYINDTLKIENINIKTFQELRRILQNLDMMVKPNYNISSLILIDRAKVLIVEKAKIFKEYLKVQMNTKKENEKKTGTLKYEEVIKEKKRQLEKIHMENELEKNKVKNLRKSATPLTKPSYLKNIVELANQKNAERNKLRMQEQALNSNNNFKGDFNEGNSGSMTIQPKDVEMIKRQYRNEEPNKSNEPQMERMKHKKEETSDSSQTSATKNDKPMRIINLPKPNKDEKSEEYYYNKALSQTFHKGFSHEISPKINKREELLRDTDLENIQKTQNKKEKEIEQNNNLDDKPNYLRSKAKNTRTNEEVLRTNEEDSNKKGKNIKSKEEYIKENKPNEDNKINSKNSKVWQEVYNDTKKENNSNKKEKEILPKVNSKKIEEEEKKEEKPIQRRYSRKNSEDKSNKKEIIREDPEIKPNKKEFIRQEPETKPNKKEIIILQKPKIASNLIENIKEEPKAKSNKRDLIYEDSNDLMKKIRNKKEIIREDPEIKPNKKEIIREDPDIKSKYL